MPKFETHNGKHHLSNESKKLNSSQTKESDSSHGISKSRLSKLKNEKKYVKIAENGINQTEVDEVVLCMTNDSKFYHQILQPISENFERKMKSGKFRKQDALETKSFVDSVGKRALEKYGDDYADDGKSWARGISIDTRRKIGQELLEHAFTTARENTFHNNLHSTDKGKALMKSDDEYKHRPEQIKNGMKVFN